MNWQLSTGSWLPIRFLSRTLNWQLSTGSWLPIRFLSRTLNWQLSTVSLLPIRWIYHKGYMKWIGNCQLAAGCQFNFYQELWIGNCQPDQFKVLDGNWIGSQLPVDSCQFISYSPYDRFIELAAGWQLTVANSTFLIEIELAASCQLPVANSFHITLMVALSNWQLADSWQLPIQSSW